MKREQKEAKGTDKFNIIAKKSKHINKKAEEDDGYFVFLASQKCAKHIERKIGCGGQLTFPPFD